MRPQRIALAFLFSLCAAAKSEAQISQPNWSAEFAALWYDTGDEANCPSGAGVALEVERRFRSSPFIGIAAGLHMADALTCTSVGTVREVDGRLLDVVAHLSLLAAPMLAVSAGPDFRLGNSAIQPRVRIGMINAEIDGPRGERHFMPLLQAGVQARRGRFGAVLRGGTLRAPVLLQSADSGEWEIVEREWHWRNIWEAGLRLYW